MTADTPSAGQPFGLRAGIRRLSLTRERRAHLRSWLPILCIPAVAVAVAARQAYLSTYYELSTWKGGGMGMFAAADFSSSRFARMFIEMPDGQRQPISKSTPYQQRLLEDALWYPSDANFRALAASMRKTNWVAPRQLTPAYRVNAKGERIGATGKSYYSLKAFGDRPDGRDPDWTLIIEFWKTSYDPLTRLIHATHVKTLRYAPGEL